jgi:hypothetical protein
MMIGGAWQGMYINSDVIVDSHIYGQYNYCERICYDGGLYIGSNCNSVTNGGTIFVYHSHLCDSNSITYSGEYLQWTYPFFVNPSSVAIYSSYMSQETVLLGSNDAGTTWEFIYQSTLATTAISTTKKYSTFKWIITKYPARTLWMEYIKIYGDIYVIQ